MTTGADRFEPPVDPDTKDWTWVLGRPCPECGFDAAATHHTDVAGLASRDADAWSDRLAVIHHRIIPLSEEQPA